MPMPSWMKRLLWNNDYGSRAQQEKRRRQQQDYVQLGVLPLEIRRVLDAGGLDPGFGQMGVAVTNVGGNDFLATAAIEDNGQIVAAGEINGDFAIARFNADGSLDTTFGGGDGFATADFGYADHALAIAVDGNGNYVLAGESNADFALARFTSAGVLDTTFDTDGMQTTDIGVSSIDQVRGVAVDSQGRIVAVGFRDNEAAVARYTSAGQLDTDFSGDGKEAYAFAGSRFGAVAIGAADEIYAVGAAVGSNGVDFLVVGYDDEGTESFAAHHDLGGPDFAYSVAIDAGTLVLGGSSAGNFALIRVSAIDGALDLSFDTDGVVVTDFGFDSEEIHSLAIQADGAILATGNVGVLGGATDWGLARYRSDGSADPTFSTDGRLTLDIGEMDQAVAVVPQASENRILVVGAVTDSGSSDVAFARFDAVTTSIKVTSSNDLSNGDTTSIDALLLDPGADGISLREAIEAANNQAGRDTITFDAGVTAITLGGTELAITEELVIQGTGVGSLTISGDDASRIFHITAGAGLVEIRDLHLTKGDAGTGSGGAILTDSSLILDGVRVDQSFAAFGGGLSGDFGASETLLVVNSTFDGNDASVSGGGINVGGAGAVVTLSHSTLSNNRSLAASTGAGGGLVVFGGADANIFNTTLSGNQAASGVGGAAQLSSLGNLVIVNSTVVNNTASDAGGLNLGSITAATIDNTILANNTATTTAAADLANTSANLVTSNSIVEFYAGDLGEDVTVLTGDVADLNLGALADNGGPTQTHALLAGSAAIDTGDSNAANAAGLTTDQRGAGYQRVEGASVDMGAFEKEPVVAPTLLSFTRQTPAEEVTSSSTLVFRATFDADVQNVTADDFIVNGTTGMVTDVQAIDAQTYDLTISTGDLGVVSSTVDLDLDTASQDITDLGNVALANVQPAVDETYRIAASVALSGSDLQVTGLSGADDLLITMDGGDVVVTDAVVGEIGRFTPGVGGFDGNLLVDLLGGNDKLTVDSSVFDAGLTVTYDGGADVDSLALTGSATKVEHQFTNENDGSVLLNDAAFVAYLGLEPIDDQINVAGDRVFTFNDDANAIVLRDDTTEGNVANVSFIDSDGSESVTFTTPTGDVIIHTGDGDDQIDIQGLDAGFNVNVIVHGDLGADTLTGPNAATAWTVDGDRSGSFTSAGLPAGVTVSFDAITNLQGGTDDDAFAVDASGQIGQINGGAGAGSDQLLVADDSAGVTSVVLTGPQSGSVSRNGLAPVLFTQIEPNTLTLTGVADVVITLPDGLTAGVILEDADGGSSGQMRLRSAAVGTPEFVAVVFDNPTGSLTIQGGNASETLTIESVDADFDAALTINLNDGAADQIVVAADLSLGSATSTGDLRLTAETISLDDGNIVTDRVIATNRAGGAAGVFVLDGDVLLGENVQVTTGGGMIDLRQATVSASATNVALELDAGLVGGGDVFLADFDNVAGGQLVGSVSVTTGGLLHLAGGVYLQGGFNLTGAAGIVVDASSVIDTDSIDNGGAGDILLGNVGVSASAAGLSLRLDATAQGNFGDVGGDITVGDVANAAGAGEFLGGFTALTEGAAVILAHGDLLVDGGLLELAGLVQLADTDADNAVRLATSGGQVDLSLASLSAGHLGITATIDSSLSGSTGGTIALGEVKGGNGIGGLMMNTGDPGETAAVTLGGDIKLFQSATVAPVFNIANDADVRIDPTLSAVNLDKVITIDLTSGSGPGGQVQWGQSIVTATAAGAELVIMTGATAAGKDGGNVTLGEVGGATPLSSFSIDSRSTTGVDGRITLGGNASTGNIAIAALQADDAITLAGSVLLAADAGSVVAWTTDPSAAAGAGKIALGNAAIAADNLVSLTLDTRSLASSGGAVTIGSVAGPLQQLTVEAGAQRVQIEGAVGSGVNEEIGELIVNAGDFAIITGGSVLVDVVNGSNAAITITTDAVQLDGTLATTGRATIDTLTAGRRIDLGVDVSGQLVLGDAELDRITASVLQIGSSSSGDILLTADVDLDVAQVATLHLQSGGAINNDGLGTTHTLGADSLALTAVDGIGNVNLLQVATGPTTLAAEVLGAGDLVLHETSDVVVGEVDGVVGLSTFDGLITLTADGQITVDRAVTAGNDGGGADHDVTLTATGAALLVNATITADDEILLTAGATATIDADLLASGPRAVINAGGAITFGTTTAVLVDSGLEATAGGSISQTEALTVAGSALFSAAGFDVVLANAANDFLSVGVTAANDATFVDVNQIVLDSISLTDVALDLGDLSVIAGGSITDSAGVVIAVSGLASFDAGGNAITLGDDAGDTVDFGQLAVSGGVVTIAEDSGTELASVAATDLILTSDGDITDVPLAPIAVSGQTTLAAGVNDILLDGQTNDFNLVVIVGASEVSLADANSLTLGDAAIAGDLIVRIDADQATVSDNAVFTFDALATQSFGGSILVSGGGDSDGDRVLVNRSVTAATSFTIQDMAEVVIVGGADLAASAGDVSLATNVGLVTFSGADGATNQITATDAGGVATVRLAQVASTNDITLTILTEAVELSTVATNLQAGELVLEQNGAGQAIDIGAAGTSDFVLTAAELEAITAARLQIGNAATGGQLNLLADVDLTNGGSVAQVVDLRSNADLVDGGPDAQLTVERIAITANTIGGDTLATDDINLVQGGTGPLELAYQATAGVFITTTGDTQLTAVAGLTTHTSGGGLLDTTGALQISVDGDYTDDMTFIASSSLTIDNAAQVTLDKATAGRLTFQAGTDLLFDTGVVVTTDSTLVNPTHTVELIAGGTVTQTNNTAISVTTNTLMVTADNGVGVSALLRFRFAADRLSVDTSANAGNQFLQDTAGDLIVASLTAGAGNIDLLGSGTLRNAVDDNTADIAGGQITLVSTGVIGGPAAGDALDIAAMGAVNVNSGGAEIRLDSLAVLNVGVIDAGAANVFLNVSDGVSNLAILDALGDDNVVDITAGLLTIEAASTVGVSRLNAVNLAVDALAINDGAGPVGPGATGDVFLTNAGSINLEMILVDGANFLLETLLGGDINNDNSDGLVSAAAITLIAAGGIGIFEDRELTTTSTGVLSLTTQGDDGDGDIRLRETNDLAASRLVVVTQTAGAAAQTVRLATDGVFTVDSDLGHLTDNLEITADGVNGGGAGIEQTAPGVLTGDRVALTATNGDIGSMAAPVAVHTDDASGGVLELTADGDIFVTSASDLTVARVATGLGPDMVKILTTSGAELTLTGDAGYVNLADDAIQLGADGLLTLSSNDLTAASLDIDTTGDNVDIDVSLTLSGLLSVDTLDGGFDLAAGEVITTGTAFNVNLGAGSGDINGMLSGAGELNLDGGQLTLHVDNDYAGLTQVNVGQLTLLTSAGLGSTLAGTIVAEGAVLEFAGGLNVLEDITLSGTLLSTGSSNTLSGLLTLASVDGGVVDTTTDLILAGQITGGGGLVKQGVAAATIQGDNDYTGVTDVQLGRLVVQHNNALGATGGANGTVVQDGAVLVVDDTAAALSISETLTLSGTGEAGFDAALVHLGENASVWLGPITLAADAAIESRGVDAGDSLTLSGGLALDEFEVAFQTTTANSLIVVDGVISQGVNPAVGSVLKSGVGVLEYRGAAANTYTGLTQVDAGVLLLNKTAGVDAIAGDLAIAGGALVQLLANEQINNGSNVDVSALGTWDLNDFDETLNELTGAGLVQLGDVSTGNVLTIGGVDADGFTFAGVIAEQGNLVKEGVGQLTLSGVNTFVGAAAITDGSVLLDATGQLTGVTAIQVGDGLGPVMEQLLLGADDRINDAAVVTVASTGQLGLQNYSETIGGLAGAGVVEFDAAPNNVLTIATVTGDNFIFSGVLQGNGDLVKSGDGEQTLAGAVANTRAGNTSVLGGSLILDKTAGVDAIAGGLVTVGDGLTGATLQLNQANQIGDGTVVLLQADGVWDLNDQSEQVAQLTGSGQAMLGAGDPTTTLTLGDANDFTFDGVISEQGDLVKVGAGVMTLTGDHTFVGAADINGGVLLLNGSLAAGATVNVNNSAVLAGVGAANGAVNIAAGGTLAPGDPAVNAGVGQFTINGLLSVADDGIVAIELNGPADHDVIVFTAGVTLDSGALLSLDFVTAPAAGDNYVFLRNDGVLTVSGEFEGFAENTAVLTAGLPARVLYQSGGDGDDGALTFDGGELVVTGTAGDDQYFIYRDGNTLHLVQGGVLVGENVVGGTTIDSRSIFSGHTIVINAGAGNDTTTILLTRDVNGAGAGDENFNNDFTGVIAFNGEADVDRVEIVSTANGTATAGRLTHQFLDSEQGELTFDNDLDGAGAGFLVQYSGTATIDSQHLAADDQPIVFQEVLLSYDSDAFDLITQAIDLTADAVVPALNRATASGGAADFVFASPVVLLSLQAGEGEDLIDVNSLGTGFDASMLIHAGAEAGDEVNLKVDLLLGSASNTGALTVVADTITVDPGVTIDTTAGTAGEVRLTANVGGVIFGDDASITTTGANAQVAITSGVGGVLFGATTSPGVTIDAGASLLSVQATGAVQASQTKFVTTNASDDAVRVLGSSVDLGDVEFGGGLTVTATSGDATLHGDLQKSGSASGFALIQAAGSIHVGPMVSVGVDTPGGASNTLAITLAADTNALGGGAIDLAINAVLDSNGGDILLGGGDAAGSGFAVGQAGQRDAVSLAAGALVLSGGGQITVRGQGFDDVTPLNNDGRGLFTAVGALIDAGAGDVLVVVSGSDLVTADQTTAQIRGDVLTLEAVGGASADIGETGSLVSIAAAEIHGGAQGGLFRVNELDGVTLDGLRVSQIATLGGNAEIRTNDGDLLLENGAITAGTGDIRLETNAAIIDEENDDAAVNLQGADLQLMAQTGVGGLLAADDDLDLSVDSVSATTVTGDIVLTETSGLTITPGGLQVTGAGGAIVVQVLTGPLLVNGQVANAGSGRVDLHTDNALIALAADVTAAGGDVTLTSANVTVAGDRIIRSNGVAAAGEIRLTGLIDAFDSSDATVDTLTILANGAVTDGDVFLEQNVGDANALNGLEISGAAVLVQNVEIRAGSIDLTASDLTTGVTLNGANLRIQNGQAAAETITVTGIVTLTTDVTVTGAQGAGDDISFSSQIHGDVAGEHTLEFAAGLGDLTVGGEIGSLAGAGRLGGLTITSARNVSLQAVNITVGADNHEGLISTSSFFQAGPIDVVGGRVEITAAGVVGGGTPTESIRLATVDSHGGDVTLTAADDVVLDGAIHSTGEGGQLLLQGIDVGTSIGLGDAALGAGAGGGVHLSSASVANLTTSLQGVDAFATVEFGRVGQSGEIEFALGGGGVSLASETIIHAAGGAVIDIDSNLATTRGGATGNALTVLGSAAAEVQLGADLATRDGAVAVTGDATVRVTGDALRTITTNALVGSGAAVELTGSLVGDGVGNGNDSLLIVAGDGDVTLGGNPSAGLEPAADVSPDSIGGAGANQRFGELGIDTTGDVAINATITADAVRKTGAGGSVFFQGAIDLAGQYSSDPQGDALDVTAVAITFADAASVLSSGGGVDLHGVGDLGSVVIGSGDFSLTGAGSAFRIDGGFDQVSLGADISTSSGQIRIEPGAGQAVTLTGDVRLDTVASGGLGADVIVLGEVDADLAANERVLAIDAGGAGNVDLQGDVGAAAAVDSVAISGLNVGVRSLFTQDGNGAGAANGIDINAVGQLTIDNRGGGATFSTVADPGGAASGVHLAAGGGILLDDLTGATAGLFSILTDSTTDGAVAIDSRLASAANEEQSLSIRAGDATATLGGVIGGGSEFGTGRLGSFESLNDTVITAALGGDSVTLSAVGGLTFGNGAGADQLLLGEDVVLAGDTMTFDAVVDSEAAETRSLTVLDRGATRFNGDIGAAASGELGALVTAAGGRTELNLNTLQVRSSDGSDATVFNDQVLVGEDLTIVQLGAANVEFATTLDASEGVNPDLVIDTTGGLTVFQGAVGSDALGALSDDEGFNSITTDGVQISGGSVTTIGDQTYQGAMELQSDLTLNSSGDIRFDSTVDSAPGAFDLVIGAGVDDVTFGAAVGGAGALGSMTQLGGSGLTTFNGVTVEGDVSIATNNITLATGTLLTNTLGGAGVSLEAMNAIVLAAGTSINATAGQILIAANADDAGSQGFTMAADASLTTTNDTAQALAITVGGAGAADIAFLRTGTGAGRTTITADSIRDINDGLAALNVQSAEAVFVAQNGVGDGNALETRVSLLAASNQQSGAIEIDNTSGAVLQIGAPTGAVIEGVTQNAAGAAIAITNNASVTVNSAVQNTSAGATTLATTAGDLTVNALVENSGMTGGDLSLTAAAAIVINESVAGAEVAITGANDAGGDLRLTAGATLSSTGQIMSTGTTGAGGAIVLQAAGDINLTTSTSLAQVVSTGATGGGDIAITATGTGNISTTAQIASLASQNAAGDITLLAGGAIAIQETTGGESEILSRGDSGGVLSLTAQNGAFSSSGQIVSSGDVGAGGDIMIQALSEITIGTAPAGALARVISMGATDAGQITIQTATGGITTTAAIASIAVANNAGDIRLDAPGAIRVNDASTGDEISSLGGGDGGNLQIATGAGLTSSGQITTTGVAGVGGAIDIDAQSGIVIAATGGELASVVSAGGTDSGSIALDTQTGAIDLTAMILSSSNSTATLHQAGAIDLTAAAGAVTFRQSTLVASLANNGLGGDITVNAQGGDFTSAGQLASVGATDGVVASDATHHGGDITLIASGGIALNDSGETLEIQTNAFTDPANGTIYGKIVGRADDNGATGGLVVFGDNVLVSSTTAQISRLRTQAGDATELVVLIFDDPAIDNDGVAELTVIVNDPLGRNYQIIIDWGDVEADVLGNEVVSVFSYSPTANNGHPVSDPVNGTDPTRLGGNDSDRDPADQYDPTTDTAGEYGGGVAHTFYYRYLYGNPNPNSPGAPVPITVRVEFGVAPDATLNPNASGQNDPAVAAGLLLPTLDPEVFLANPADNTIVFMENGVVISTTATASLKPSGLLIAAVVVNPNVVAATLPEEPETPTEVSLIPLAVQVTQESVEFDFFEEEEEEEKFKLFFVTLDVNGDSNAIEIALPVDLLLGDRLAELFKRFPDGEYIISQQSPGAEPLEVFHWRVVQGAIEPAFVRTVEDTPDAGDGNPDEAAPPAAEQAQPAAEAVQPEATDSSRIELPAHWLGPNVFDLDRGLLHGAEAVRPHEVQLAAADDRGAAMDFVEPSTFFLERTEASIHALESELARADAVQTAWAEAAEVSHEMTEATFEADTATEEVAGGRLSRLRNRLGRVSAAGAAALAGAAVTTVGGWESQVEEALDQETRSLKKSARLARRLRR
ncbi:beta strand repeat-containing protein [Lignipirellula cremea]|uniref:Autotransporter-associated beta strand repeat protein n=1 Tax=Lignipirellula cremea TaxID=2528010 RepID=A0A518DSX3_9BACT|nr:choice-of-anchor Q domain-containing protein [Lignipirellula cremea]QDU94933.1 Autotransporter-associated beta strand repeat protein [Lignipirellula cremea]